MTYSYIVSESFFVTIIDSDGQVALQIGPWENATEATAWADIYVANLNNGSAQDPRKVTSEEEA